MSETSEPSSSAPDTAGPSKEENVLYTVGHATRSLEELVSLLHQQHAIKTLVDVRTMPRSRTNPQFNKQKLEAELPTEHGVAYRWMGKELGGLRKRNKDLGDMNGGWENASFRGYADYMQSPEFKAGLKTLMEAADAGSSDAPCCIMCAEAYHRRCHRALISDALAARGWKVLHISTLGKPAAPHGITRFAVIERNGEDGDVNITYPPYDSDEEGKGKKPKKKAKKDAKQPKLDSFVKKKGSKRKAPESGGSEAEVEA